MSQIHVDNIYDKTGSGKPEFPAGLTASGPVSIAGTLTYEDVTNIDAVGLVTARTGVRITAGGLVVTAGVTTFSGADINIDGSAVGVTSVTWDASADSLIWKDNSKARFGDSGDLSLYHDGSHSYIDDSGTGSLYIKSNQFMAIGANGETMIQATEDSGVYLRYNNGVKFETTATGVSIGGTTISSGGDFITYDNGAFKSGNGAEVSLWHNNTATFGENGYLRNLVGDLHINGGNSAGNIYINLDENVAGVTSDRAASFIRNGAVELYYDANKKIETTNDGVNITGMTTCTTGAHFQGMLRENCNIVANKLSAGTNIDLANGMVHYYSTNETTTATPNIRWNSSYSLNNKMSTGEAVTVTIIYKPNNAGYYAALTVDGSGVTEEWNGGDAPDSANSGGYDVLTHTLVKTANATFLCLSNVQNYA